MDEVARQAGFEDATEMHRMVASYAAAKKLVERHPCPGHIAMANHGRYEEWCDLIDAWHELAAAVSASTPQ